MHVIRTSSFNVYENDLNKFYKRTVDIIYAFIIAALVLTGAYRLAKWDAKNEIPSP
jgi:hypothetical protein